MVVPGVVTLQFQIRLYIQTNRILLRVCLGY